MNKIKFKNGMCFNTDCMKLMKEMKDNSVDLTLTDIPYDEVNRKSNGLRNLNKGKADVSTFDLSSFLDEVYRVTKGTTIIFCGQHQLSEIYNYFVDFAKKSKGTVRQLVWAKTNPSPMNGKYIYLSGAENAIWFKKKGATFNAHCKSNVFSFPCGRGKLHPTEKNHDLIKDLILDNSNEGEILFDPCAGGGTHLYLGALLNRKVIGSELNEEYFEIIKDRFKEENK